MKKLGFLALSVLLASLLVMPVPVKAEWDSYEQSQSHPLRAAAYILHPVGVVLEWTVARPGHFLVSSTPPMEWLFGHTPHPYPALDSKSFLPSAKTRTARPGEAPGAERVIVKEVVKEVVVERRVVERVAAERPAVEAGVEPGAPGEQVGAGERRVEAAERLALGEEVAFGEVHFQFNRADLNDLGRGKAYLVAERLKADRDVVISIEGHTDSRGTDEYNQQLGLRRAQSVMKELVAFGIEAERLSVTSLGETTPVVAKETEWAHALNRRVDFRLALR